MGGLESGLVQSRLSASQALYCADAGIEHARFRLNVWNQWTTWTETINTPQIDGVGGTANVQGYDRLLRG